MSNSNNQLDIPQAREAMDKFKILFCPRSATSAADGEEGVSRTNCEIRKK